MGEIINLDKRIAGRSNGEKESPCALCQLERMGYNAQEITAQLLTMKKYLEQNPPEKDDALAMKITRGMDATNLSTLARLTMNWGKGHEKKPLYTKILSYYTDKKLREAQTEHLMHNPPPPDMI